MLSGTGFDGEQALGVQLLQLGQKKRQVMHGEPLPLSRKSYLAWMGFSAEGESLPQLEQNTHIQHVLNFNFIMFSKLNI